MEKLGFNILQIAEEIKNVGERFVYPSKETFLELDERFSLLNDGIYYEIEVEKDDDFLWIFFDYGKPNPRDENLTDIKTGEKRVNDREITEAELLKQFFCLYHYKQQLLYISNSKKQNVLKAMLKQQIKKDFIFKTLQKTKEQFMELLVKINKISFTEACNLFSSDSKKRQALVDLTGTDSPENFTLEVMYSQPWKFTEFLQSLFDEQKDDALKELIICGTDERDFEIIFNNETFNKKIEINAQKDENGKYIAISVRENLLKVIMQ